MDDLLAEQAELHSSIQNLYDNFKKENKQRRHAIAKKKTAELNDLYKRFTTNHLILDRFEDKSSDYFTGNHFEETKDFYYDTCAYIMQFMEEKQDPEPNSGTSGSGTNKNNNFDNEHKESEYEKRRLDEKLRRQTANFKAFSRTITNIDLETFTENWEYEDALKTLESRWKTIDNLHWDIVCELTDENNERMESTYNSYEKQYNKLKKAINSKMWSEKHREKTTPKLEVPTFNGNFNQWVSFKDLFTEAIHGNPTLSNAQKMQFLKSKVRGEAERLIQHLSISSDNYTVSWDILNNRFNNKKLIFSSHINNLLELPIMKQQSLQHIKRMHDVTQESLNAIKNLGVDVKTWDPLIVHILDLKLDTDSHSEYIDSLKDRRELPTLKDFLNFLEGKFTAMESARRKSENIPQKHAPTYGYQNNYQQASNQRKTTYNQTNNWNTGNKQYAKSSFNATVIRCPLCNNEHGLYHCKKFLDLSNEQKLRTIKELKVCINCLFTHNNNECKSKLTCRICAKKHNTMMHSAVSGSSTSTASVATSSQTNEMKSHISQKLEQNQHQSTEVLLSTAVVKVKGADGTYHNMRALVDQGSQVSLITERAAQLLKIKRIACKGTVLGVGEKENKSKGMINIECHSIHTNYKLQTDVVIMNNLIGNLPNTTFKKPEWSFIENIALADPEFYISRPVDILFGADIYSEIIQGGMIKGEHPTQPIVQQTKLGWLLCGGAKTYQCNVLLHGLDDMKKFWEIEEISEQTKLSVQDQQCIAYYNETTNRLENGRYNVRLPLKEDIENKLGLSKHTALAQFRSLEKKLQRDPKLANDYKTFMNEYTSLQHMKLASGNTTPEYYLPHHGVERADALTTKYRVVFNASHKTNTGSSLNDLMYTGPNLQIDLQMLLLKWRQYQYAFTADIEKMFRMILIDKQDQKYQKIFWRETPEQPIKSFNLTTVTYGTRAAPFLAMMTLRRLAADERTNYPEAAKVVETAFYMDDLVHGTDSIEEGKKLISDLNSLMLSGGFNLRKWSSNEQKVLEGIKSQRSKLEDDVFNFKTENESKTLGLCWNSTEDVFTFNYKTTNDTTKRTKRILLSEISKQFDPLGWLAPLTTKLKLLFQQLWKEDIGWDDEVTNEINNEWTKIKMELPIINQYKVPRWLLARPGDVIELHGFCDASINAYACVVYARIKNQTKTVLVAAKTKLVPYKKAITLPRLELSGAHLMSKLMSKIKEALSQHKLEIYGWTDSMVALAWLQGEPNRWRPFVANRVKQTTDVMPSTCWRYVMSSENPADAASRGLYARQLKDNMLWWHGPSWLSTFESRELTETYTTDEETKTYKQKQTNVLQSQESNIIDCLLHKYSSFDKVIRIVAWLLRTFALKSKQMPSFLTLQELSAAKQLIIKHVQHNEYRADIEHLRNHGKVATKSQLLNLNPFIDQSSILRVGGRLKNSTLNQEMKHPKIIPRDSRLAELLISVAHKLTFHGGPRLTQANLRLQYWIPGGNNAVKKQLRDCVICRKNNPTKQYQLMGDLPAARTEPAHPFYHTGVDYTGFVDIKANKTRNARTFKGYIALFICMVTKAIHLELVTDLTSSAFLAALRRMSARRGAPRHLYSDCGTNFVGANRILQEEYETLRQTFDGDFMGVLASMEIEWHFNAPSWPSAGGLWERAVRSLKHHIRRVVGEQRLTFEEYSTILAQLEACLNSRPLCALTENIDDLDCLTPAHFLTGRAEVTVIETAEDARTRWHLTQQLFQQIWQRWRTEYLTLLNTRNKWMEPQTNIQEGDLVIIQDDNLPPGKWQMARVVQLHPGQDGYIRVVTLKTENGMLKRPIVKLCKLPVKPTKPASESSKENKDKTKKTKMTSHSLLYSVVMSVLFFMTLVSTSHGTSNIMELNKNQSLYFDPLAKMQLIREKWTLVAYYNMSPYWDGMSAFEKLLNYLEITCDMLQSDNKCNLIAPHLRHEYTELQYYNQLLLTQHYTEHPSRQRRGLIDGVGYLANSLFGVLDQRFAEQYTRDIKLIQQNEAHLKNLWSKQTSVVESEYNLVKRTEQFMNKQHKIINKHLNSLDKAVYTLQNEVNKINKEDDFTMTAIYGSSLLQTLKTIQNMMLDTISDIYQGQFNLHLLTPNQLQDQLNIISGLLSSAIKLPIDNIQNELRNIYPLMKIHTRVTEEYFIFEIKIPLVSRELYDLYRIIPISMRYGSNIITLVPVSEYVALNLQKDSYLPITYENLQKCIKRDGSTYICDSQHPIHKMKSDRDLCILDKNKLCKTSISTCKNKFINLARMNTYLYFCCEQCQVRMICGDQVTAHQLMHTNVITLQDDCVIKTDDFTIIGHKDHQSKINVTYHIDTATIAPINHIINITIDKGTQELNGTENERIQLSKEIEAKLKQMRQEESYLNENMVSYHDIHHYTLIYSIVIVMALIFIVVIWRRVRGSWKTPPTAAPQTAPTAAQPRERTMERNIPEEHEMKVFSSEKVKQPVVFRKLIFSDN